MNYNNTVTLRIKDVGQLLFLFGSCLMLKESRQLSCLYKVENAESIAYDDNYQPNVERENFRITHFISFVHLDEMCHCVNWSVNECCEG